MRCDGWPEWWWQRSMSGWLLCVSFTTLGGDTSALTASAGEF